MTDMILHTINIDDEDGNEVGFAAVTIPWASAHLLLDGERWNGYQYQREILHREIPALWRTVLGYSDEYRDEIYVETDEIGLRVIGDTIERLSDEHRALVRTDRTIAERLSDLNGDGQSWETADGRDWTEVLEEAAVRSRQKAHDVIRYEFADGSTIVACGSCWDLGHEDAHDDCYCWPEAYSRGHADDCIVQRLIRTLRDGGYHVDHVLDAIDCGW